jgi:hypothetical protein
MGRELLDYDEGILTLMDAWFAAEHDLTPVISRGLDPDAMALRFPHADRHLHLEARRFVRTERKAALDHRVRAASDRSSMNGPNVIQASPSGGENTRSEL